MKALPTSIALLMAVSATAQRQWLLDTGSVWNITECIMSTCRSAEWRMVGDTMVAGTTYQKLQVRDVSGSGPWYYSMALREDGQGRVYVLFPWGSTDEELVYDFTLGVGDVFTGRSLLGCHVLYTVSAIDSVTMLNGEKRRRTMFMEDPWEEWIEGIGSIYGLPNSMVSLCAVDFSARLLCWHRNDTLMYFDDWFQTCDYNTISIREDDPPRVLRMFPNPAGDRISIRDIPQGPPVHYEVADMAGASVAHGMTNDGSISVGMLAPGAYSLRIITPGGTLHGRFIKE